MTQLRLKTWFRSVELANNCHWLGGTGLGGTGETLYHGNLRSLQYSAFMCKQLLALLHSALCSAYAETRVKPLLWYIVCTNGLHALSHPPKRTPGLPTCTSTHTTADSPRERP